MENGGPLLLGCGSLTLFHDTPRIRKQNARIRRTEGFSVWGPRIVRKNEAPNHFAARKPVAFGAARDPSASGPKNIGVMPRHASRREFGRTQKEESKGCRIAWMRW